MVSLGELIREETRKHLLENNGLLYGQCISAVGWVAGTVPALSEDQGIVELPTSDASNGGIVCGAALMGRRPIYVCRYQGFMWYNAVSLVNYAAKSLTLWRQPCPVFIRAIAMEGYIGPVASHMHHSMVLRMPGIVVAAPFTPKEWLEVWRYFQSNPHPVYCSEHRSSYNITENYDSVIRNPNGCTIVAIGASRLSAIEAKSSLSFHFNIDVNLIHQYWLKPLDLSWLDRIKKGPILVVDSDYEEYGAASHIAQKIHQKTGFRTAAMGLQQKVAGFSSHTDVTSPTAQQIKTKVLELLGYGI